MTDDLDERPLPMAGLLEERLKQHLEPLQAALVSMAEANQNVINTPQLEELIRLGIDCGVIRADAVKHLRDIIRERRIQLHVAVAAPVPASPPENIPLASPALVRWCPQCTVTASEPFCGKCGLSLGCPRCKRDYQEGNRFCPGCGLDPLKHRQFQDHVEVGRQHFASAQNPAPHADRLALAKLAWRAFAEALERCPDDAATIALRADAQKLTVALLWQASAAAHHEQQFGRALQLLQRLQKEPAEAAKAGPRILEIANLLKQVLADAQRDAAAGKWKSALKILTVAKQQFPDDAEVSTALSQCQENFALIQKAIQESIPKLRQEQRLVELLQVLHDLQKKQLYFDGLTANIEASEKKLQWADGLMELAQQYFQDRCYAQALGEAEKVLAGIADHARALQMKKEIEAWSRQRDEAAARFDEAFASQRWFQAQVALGGLEKLNLLGTVPIAKVVAVEAGIVRANDFLRFVGWSFLAGGLFCVAADMARGLKNALAQQLPDYLFGVKVLTDGVLASTAHLTSLAVLSFLLLAFLLACMRRPLPSSFVCGWLASIVGGIGATSLLGGIAIEYGIADFPSSSHGLIHGFSAVAMAAGAGALLGCLVPALSNRILPTADGWWTPLLREAVVMSVVCVGLCLAGSRLPGFLMEQLSVAILFFGLLVLAGLGTQRHFFVLLVAAIFASGLNAGLARVSGAESVVWPWVITSAVLATTAYFIAPQRRGPADLAWSLVLAAAAFGICQFVLRDPLAAILVPTWMILCGIVAKHRFSVSDARLHLLDRFGKWRDCVLCSRTWC